LVFLRELRGIRPVPERRSRVPGDRGEAVHKELEDKDTPVLTHGTVVLVDGEAVPVEEAPQGCKAPPELGDDDIGDQRRGRETDRKKARSPTGEGQGEALPVHSGLFRGEEEVDRGLFQVPPAVLDELEHPGAGKGSCNVPCRIDRIDDPERLLEGLAGMPLEVDAGPGFPACCSLDEGGESRIVQDQELAEVTGEALGHLVRAIDPAGLGKLLGKEHVIPKRSYFVGDVPGVEGGAVHG